MTLYRLKLRPRSPWRTPWQADTLTGMLLATCARTHGPDVLRSLLIDPMLAGDPPFVLSDALPGDLLPFPITLRLGDWPQGTDFKALKRACWLEPDHFQTARTGHRPPFDTLIPDAAIFKDHTRQHNTLSRDTDATFTAEQGGGIYQRPETFLLDSPDSARDHLSLYFRILDPDRQAAGDLLLDLLHELSLTGFGADTSTGRGQFDITDDPQPMPALDSLPSDAARSANAVISLSTFQPGLADPTDGYWDAFPKFGKLGPELASLAGDHRKNTLILFKPGACFRTDPNRPFMGRAVPMHELLPESTTTQLHQRQVNIIHPAFGLCVPASLSWEIVE